jgi:hypothetical protein
VTRRRSGFLALLAAAFLAVAPEAHADREYAVDGISVARATSVVAGVPGGGFSGDGGPAVDARLDDPESVAALPDGGYLIADSDNNRIRRVSPGGIITTVAGGGLGDAGCSATRSFVAGPTTVAATANGLVTLTDRGVRQVAGGVLSTVTDGDPFAPSDAEP